MYQTSYLNTLYSSQMIPGEHLLVEGRSLSVMTIHQCTFKGKQQNPAINIKLVTFTDINITVESPL